MQYVDGKLDLQGIKVPDGATEISLGNSRIRFDEKNPPVVTNGYIARASLIKGKLGAEQIKDPHKIGLLIKGSKCSENRNGIFFPGEKDCSFLGATNAEEIRFHAMNGSSRSFTVESPTQKAIVLYQQGGILVEAA